MTIQELLNTIRDLGFSDDDEMTDEDFRPIVFTGINLALSQVNQNVAPIIGKYEFEQDGTDESMNYYDLSEETGFIDFAEIPIQYSEDEVLYKKFNDYHLEGETLVMPGDISGNFRILYKKEHTPVTEETDKTSQLEVPKKAHNLVAFLAAYYVWREDDPEIASMCYSEYENKRVELVNETEKPKARIISNGVTI